MIPKDISLSNNTEYEWRAYFMSYYFPHNKALIYPNLETQQNKRFRNWLIKFKDLVEDGVIKNNYSTTVEFNLFKIIINLFIKNKILKGKFNTDIRIGLMNVPSHLENLDNSVSLLIKELSKDEQFIDMTKTIYRSDKVPRATRDAYQKKKSMSWNIDEIQKIKQISLDSIIVIDDVYTSGATAISMFQKIKEADLDILGSNICNLCINDDVKFFAFGKTLSEEEIKNDDFSSPNKEIYLPEISNNKIYSKEDNNKFKASLNNIK